MTTRSSRVPPGEVRGWAARRPRLNETERRGVIVVLAAGLVFLAAIVAAKILFDLDASDALLDPSVVADVPDYVGVGSHVGVLGWTVGATAALVGATLTPSGRMRTLLVAAGVLTGVAALDDLFRGHENIGAVLPGEEGQNVVVAATGLVALAIGWRLRDVLAGTPYGLVAGAALLFAVSVGTDVIFDRPGVEITGRILVEESAKLFGILLWSSYLVIVARRAVAGGDVSGGIESG